MADETDNENHTATSDTSETTSLGARVAAMEQALAALGDAVCPGGVSTLKAWHDWRKSIGS